MKEIRFDIQGEPVPASRPRVTQRGSFYPKKHTAYVQFLKTELLKHPSLQIENKLVEARLLFVMPPYKESLYPTSRCDLDNLSKLPIDCMTKSVETNEAGDVQFRYWKDDSLIAILLTMKTFARPGENPHTKVLIRVHEGDVDTIIRDRFLT